MKKKLIFVCAILMLSTSTYAECPSADLTGDCFVDFQDFVVMASQWMTGKPDIPQAIVWVYIDDPGIPDHEGFTGKMSKYETTNAQYCQFLNAALASGDITVEADDKVYGAGGSNSGEDFVGQMYYDLAGLGVDYSGLDPNELIYVGAAKISYSGSLFTVDSGFDDHPVTYVYWYGATAFCNYYGYRLPTEWEWQAVADYDGSFAYGCGTSINNSIANYEASTHPDGTTAVGSFGSYGYGLCDMAGNVYEWTSSLYDPQYGSYILRGGSWYYDDNDCNASQWNDGRPDSTNPGMGFRVCLAETRPVAHWQMDETDVIAGSVIADSSGRDNDGIARDAMTSVNGVIGGALSFNGIDDYVDIADNPTLDMTTELTVTLWMKQPVLAINKALVAKWDYPTQGSWGLQTDHYDSDELRVFVATSLDDSGLGGNGRTTGANMIAGNWYHVAFVYDGAGAVNADRLKIYVDGEEKTLSFVGTIPSFLQDSSATVKIGKFGGILHRYFNGTIDEVRIYNRALSQAELQ